MKNKKGIVRVLVLTGLVSSVCAGISAEAPTALGAFASPDAKKVAMLGVSIGNDAVSEDTYGMAIGSDAKALKGPRISNGVASATAPEKGLGAIAIGGDSTAKGMGAVTIGMSSKADGEFNTAVGTKATITGSTKYQSDSAIAIGNSNITGGGYSISVGAASSITDTRFAVAMGAGATVRELAKTGSTVIDKNAEGKKTITADGNGNYTVEATTSSTEELKKRNGEAYGASALGMRASAHNLGALATGMYSTAIGESSVAVGHSATTLKDSAVAVGGRATAHENKSTAIGYYSDANAEGSVAIGYYSTANREKGMIGYIPNAKVTDDASLKAFTAETKTDESTWKATLGAVSIGSEGDKKTRQITNLAAGTEDTDAVNVAQLKRITQNISGTTNELNIAVKGVEQSVRSLEQGVIDVGAQSAALAALKVMPYSEDNKVTFSAGVGAYQGKKAVAIGGSYYPNENVLVSIGGAFGSHNIMNMGVSFKVGQEGKHTASTDKKPSEVEAKLVTENNMLKAEVSGLKEEVSILKQQMQMLLAKK